MQILRAAFGAALLLLSAAVSATAEDVTLTARDGSVELSGTLLSFDGEFYRIETEFGILTVDGSGVNCDGPGCPGLGPYVAEFTISGAPALSRVLMPALIEGFSLRHGFAMKREAMDSGASLFTLYDGSDATPAARITIRPMSSSKAFADLLGEQADMVLSLREVSGGERMMALEAGLGNLSSVRQARVLALDALVPVVAPGNPVRRISVEDLAAVFAGRVTRWSELNGEDAPITLHLQDPAMGFGHVFQTRVLEELGLDLAETVVFHPSMASLARAVAEDPFSIGITSHSQIGNAEPVTLTGACGFELAATTASIKAEDYPFTVPLYLYLPGRRLPKTARDFLIYMRGMSAQLVTRRAGLVDQGLEEIGVETQGRRLVNAILSAGEEVGLEELQRLAGRLTDSKRLTLTFRFQGGSSALDASSRSNVALLADALVTGQFDGRRLSFIGFSDSDGTAPVNLQLSRKRAVAVRDAVLKEAETLSQSAVTIDVDGFGEALPVACDDMAWGRQANRRVEIWVE